MALQEDIENFTTTVEDAVSYPILTRDTSDYPFSKNGSSSSSGNGITATTRTAKQTIRDVLGWRYRTDDAKGFLAALNKSFSLKEVEGHVEWDWKAQSYMVQADMGEITGAQASVYKQASVALENALPLLDGLTPLRTDADAEDTEAMRAIIRTEMNELVSELGITGGPRVQRVDLFFEKLIGPLSPTPSFNPEHVKGQLARLRQRFGLTRARVNTITEEQNLTNFLILVDYVNGLYQSWDSKRGFFDGSAEPFLGTQLVLISEVLDAILEQLQETYDAMDSVFFGPAERQTTEIELGPGRGSLSVAEILSWVENFAATEGRQLIQEGGKDGVVVFNSTIIRLTQIVQTAADIAALPSTNPVRPFHTRRVALALGELASYLNAAKDRASQISRRTMYAVEHQGKEENQWWDLSPAIPYTALTRVDNVDWFERKEQGTNKWRARQSGDEIFPGDEVKMVLWGSFAHLPLSLEFDSDITLEGTHYDPSKRKVVALVRISDTATSGPRSLLIEDCEGQKRTIHNALFISPHVQKQTPDEFKVTDMDPHCGHQGQTKCVKFTGEGLSGCGVCFGRGNNIRTKGTSYSDGGKMMEAEIVISRRARIGQYPVMLFMADGRSAMAPKKFEVFAEMQSALATFEFRQAAEQIDECEQKQTTDRPGSVEQEMPHGATDADKKAQTETEGYPVASCAPTVRAALEPEGITKIKEYRKDTSSQPEKLQKGKDRKLEFELKAGQKVKKAWVVSKGERFTALKSADIQQQGTHATIFFEPTAQPPQGTCDVVKLMDDNSVEHVEDAVICK